jgi:hypothetical protein
MVSSSYFKGEEKGSGDTDCRKEVGLDRFLLKIGVIPPALLLFLDLRKRKQIRPERLDLMAMLTTPQGRLC